MLKENENGCYEISLFFNLYYKTQMGYRLFFREGLGLAGSYRAPPNPI